MTLLSTQRARAQGAPHAAEHAEVEPAAAREAAARRLFERGNVLREAGDCATALGLFLESRALLASASNTLNAAYCLFELGRQDEALELYEAVLLDHGEAVDAELRAKLRRRVASIVGQVARVSIHSSVTATLVVDGRSRGQVPSLSPLVLLAGEHEIRLVRSGYQQRARRLRVEAGESRDLHFELRPLKARGVVRVSDPSRAAGNQAPAPGSTPALVWIDGALVGRAPWEGALAPGEHLVSVVQGDRGTGPRRVVALQGQISVFDPNMQPLGPELSIESEPGGATLSLDGVRLPDSVFLGRLPLGPHQLWLSAEGYLPTKRRFVVTVDGPKQLSLQLRADLNHPRWSPQKQAALRLGVVGRYLNAAGLDSGPESCAGFSCDQRDRAQGVWLGADLDYVLPSGLLLSAGLGYTRFSVSSARHVDEPDASGGSVRFSLRDDTLVSGPWLAAGLGYARAFAAWEARAGLGLALVLAEVSLDTSGGVSRVGATPAQQADVVVANRGASSGYGLPLVAPELELARAFDKFRVAISLGLLWAPIRGPSNSRGDATPVSPNPVDCTGSPPPVACARASAVTRAERSAGRFVLIAPGLRLSYTL